jgi:hypothetical protein
LKFSLFQQAMAELCRGDWSYPLAKFAGEKEQLCLARRFDISSQDACASYQNQWCTPAQSKEPSRGDTT